MWVWSPFFGQVAWGACSMLSSGRLRGRPGPHGLKRQLAVLGQKQLGRSCVQSAGPRPERALSPLFQRRL